VTNGTATKDLVTSVAPSGTQAYLDGSSYVYNSPDHSIENSGSTGGSYECDIHQSYNGSTLDSFPGNGNSSGYSGWILGTFNPQTALGWPSFTTCTVTVLPGYNSQSLGYGSGGTATDSCLAGPLQLP
jgi:hypothetical protein